MVTERAERAVALIDKQIQELTDLYDPTKKDGAFEMASERLARWERHTIDLLSEEVNPEEGKRFKERITDIAKEQLPSLPFFTGDLRPIQTITNKAKKYTAFLLALRDDLSKHPESVLRPAITKGKVSVVGAQPPAASVKARPPAASVKARPPAASVKARPPAASRTVFVIHGHDEINRLRLESLLRDHWHLEPIVLISEPGKGRTLIEKFEEEAQRAAYVIALLTPDDQVKISEAAYAQVRPNATFELGWFYGRLGRKKVCILFREGTKIHSDLDGISRIEFENSVTEAAIELEKELRTAGLL